MKQLTLHSEAYRYIIASFKEWLQTLGYSEQTVYQLPNYIQEFLFYAESKGYAGLFQITNDLMKEHYYKLKDRGKKNSRRNKCSLSEQTFTGITKVRRLSKTKRKVIITQAGYTKRRR